MKPRLNKQPIDFFQLYDRLINDMRSGKKKLPNGNLYRESSIETYIYVKKKLFNFAQETTFDLRLRNTRSLTTRELIAEENYWKKFYRKFSDYLYKNCNHKDNYVGSHMKTLRSFFNYVRKDLKIDIGDFNSLFYVCKEEIPIITFTTEQLQFLIYNTEFENTLPEKLKRTKDICVFGCTVALRYSDLMNLTKPNLIKNGNCHFISVRAKKTKVYTMVKLPPYTVAILNKYKKLRPRLLPAISNFNLNKNLKELIEKAGWIEPIGKKRERRGQLKEIKKGTQTYRFCDHISTHTMRRTAITTMLTLGVPEHVVRSISGHTAGSKEFFRYVDIAQEYKDRELDKMHEKLKKTA